MQDYIYGYMSPSLQILKHNMEVEVDYLFLNAQFQGDKENGKKHLWIGLQHLLLVDYADQWL